MKTNLLGRNSGRHSKVLGLIPAQRRSDACHICLYHIILTAVATVPEVLRFHRHITIQIFVKGADPCRVRVLQKSIPVQNIPSFYLVKYHMKNFKRIIVRPLNTEVKLQLMYVKQQLSVRKSEKSVCNYILIVLYLTKLINISNDPKFEI